MVLGSNGYGVTQGPVMLEFSKWCHSGFTAVLQWC
jgi:hypothetical protein